MHAFQEGSSRCRHTGQNQPLALRFLRGVGVGAAAAAAVAAASSACPAVAAVLSPEASTAGEPSAGASSDCWIVPPAPNSIMFSAHSLHATRCRHGSSTTSRGEDRQSRHSDDGSSSCAGAGAALGGYDAGVGDVGATGCDECAESP